MSFTVPFQVASDTVNINAGVASANVALLGGNLAAGYSVRVRNSGAVDVFIKFGTSTVAAALASDLPIAAGSVETLTLPPGTTHVAAITASGTSVIYFTPGGGL